MTPHPFKLIRRRMGAFWVSSSFESKVGCVNDIETSSCQPSGGGPVDILISEDFHAGNAT